ncbi:4-hydroxy-tetrahydrodipicolinate reductase [Brachybacterium aquaticum]|uniref:4-hydroxy-tetrahydrodipicolinate reductase n=1 Tax=Brachybacterium aquaticum TaxID=1432564 RepID=A0A841AFK6_9MICO|nr:4-hydroxy-tetrahydrodipicolinate reductase [Brachybacterium aquaticum]MBB5832042.1 4-hydroxy-tetrahydrodipicolinate reductase [Brachybacterium aquaticum]
MTPQPAPRTATPEEPLRVAVLGARGRMGSAACTAVEEAPDLELVAALGRGDDLTAVTEAGAEIAIDLTVPSATAENVRWLVEHGIHAVVGTTGWTEETLGALREQLAAADGIGVLIAPNFAIGAVLAMRFAEVAARYYDSAEIIEMHHPNKLDAPSGTARHTAAAIARGRAAAGLGPVPDATEKDPDGARGAVVDGIHVHAVRQQGLVAHEVVQFGGVGEQFVLRHDSFDRVSFMPGVLLGVREVAAHPGLTVGLDGYMDLG